MSVIVGKLFDKGGTVILNLVIWFIFVYTRDIFMFKILECWSVKKYQHCRLTWKLCIVCEVVLKKKIAETLTKMVLLFMIILIWKWNYGSKVLPHDDIYIYIYYIYGNKYAFYSALISFFWNLLDLKIKYLLKSPAGSCRGYAKSSALFTWELSFLNQFSVF